MCYTYLSDDVVHVRVLRWHVHVILDVFLHVVCVLMQSSTQLLGRVAATSLSVTVDLRTTKLTLQSTCYTVPQIVVMIRSDSGPWSCELGLVVDALLS